MGSTGDGAKRPSDAALIDGELIEAGLEELAERTRTDGEGVLERETVLQEFAQQRLLMISGKMIMANAPAEIARGSVADFHQVLDLCVNVVASAYRLLLDDLLPETELEGNRTARPSEGSRRIPVEDDEAPPDEEQNEEGR